MGRKTIYVKDGNQEVIEWAEQTLGESLSDVFADCLRQRKQKAERQAELSKDGFETIAVELEDGESGRIRKKQFEGKWLVSEFESDDSNIMIGTQYNAAFTKRGSIAVMVGSRNDTTYGGFFVFESFDELADSDFPKDFITAVGAELDEDYVEVLDI